MFGLTTKEKIARLAKADTGEDFEQIINIINSGRTPEESARYGKQAVDEYFAQQNYLGVSLLSRKLGANFHSEDMKYAVPICEYAIDRLIEAKKFDDVAWGAVGEARSYGIDKLLAEGSPGAIMAAVEIDFSPKLLGRVLDLNNDATSVPKENLQTAVRKLTKNLLEPSSLLKNIGDHKERKEMRALLARVDQSGLSDVKLAPVFDSAVKIAAQNAVSMRSIAEAQAVIKTGQATFASTYKAIFEEPAATQG